jgi:FkbM family methyltransferase
MSIPPVACRTETYGRRVPALLGVDAPAFIIDAVTCFSFAPWWSEREPVQVCLEGYDAGDKIAYSLRTQKTFWEVDQLEYLAMVGPVGGIYLDVGANIGNHAVFFGSFCAEHVVAFEPHPRLHDILRQNLAANGLRERSTVVPTAISDSPGIGAIALRHEYAGNIGASHVIPTGAVASGEDVVTLRRLDDVLDELMPSLPRLPITFLKIDVEGMEMAVLRSASRLLETHRPQILVELITDDAVTAASALLQALGYEPVARLGSPPAYHFIVPGRHTLRENRWHGGSHHAHHLHVAQQELASVTSADAVVVIADLDEGGFGSTIAGRTRMPFLEKDGKFFGPPATDEQAIAELDRLHHRGATHLAVLWPAFWFFDTYPRWTTRLRTVHRVLVDNDRIAIFELRG